MEAGLRAGVRLYHPEKADYKHCGGVLWSPPPPPKAKRPPPSTPAIPSLPCISPGTSSLLSPGFRRQDFLLLFFVIFVDFIDTLRFLHVVGQFPGFLGHTTPGSRHGRGTGEVVASTPPPRCNFSSLGLRVRALHLPHRGAHSLASQGSHDTYDRR